MNFINTSPEWQNQGEEPTDEIKQAGFQAGYKPPADFFNWFWNRVCNCIKELQEKLIGLDTSKANKSTDGGGFAGGSEASVAEGKMGGAVGYQAYATNGGASGRAATTENGGAAGCFSNSGRGFAGGYNAKTGNGVAVGNGAKTVDSKDVGIDAIQLGEGTNSNAKTMQVYTYRLLDENGNIPNERMPQELQEVITPSNFEQALASSTTIEDLVTRDENDNCDSYLMDRINEAYHAAVLFPLAVTGKAIANVHGTYTVVNSVKKTDVNELWLSDTVLGGHSFAFYAPIKEAIINEGAEFYIWYDSDGMNISSYSTPSAYKITLTNLDFDAGTFSANCAISQ